MVRAVWVIAAGAAGLMLATGAQAVAVTFASAAATYHQTFDRNWDPSEMIDGVISGANGWAIYRADGAADQTLNETALFTTATPLVGGLTTLTFTIYQNDFFAAYHELGDFSLGYTTAATPTLASAQTALHLTSESSLNGATFTSPATGQLLVSGTLPATDVYTIKATVDSASPITGFFLNAIDDPNNGLPTGGPGRAGNGNFVINEFTLAASPGGVPEPTTWALLLAGFAATGMAARRRRITVAG